MRCREIQLKVRILLGYESAIDEGQWYFVHNYCTYMCTGINYIIMLLNNSNINLLLVALCTCLP